MHARSKFTNIIERQLIAGRFRLVENSRQGQRPTALSESVSELPNIAVFHYLSSRRPAERVLDRARPAVPVVLCPVPAAATFHKPASAWREQATFRLLRMFFPIGRYGLTSERTVYGLFSV